MRARAVLPWFVLGLVVSVAYRAGADVPFVDVLDPRTTAADDALKTARASGDFSGIRAALQPLFDSKDKNVNSLSLRWIGAHRKDMPATVIDDLERAFLETNPTSTLSRGLREARAWDAFRRSPQGARIPYYREAVANGHADVRGGFVLTRRAAIVEAASEGLTEFAPEIDRYSKVIDAVPTSRSPSGRLRWLMKLRAGATSREEAIRLHAGHLSGMPVEEFENLMQGDKEFAGSTLELAHQVCGQGRLSEGCVLLGRQVEQVLAKTREGSASEPALREESGVGPQWLTDLRNETFAARVPGPKAGPAPSPQQP